MRGNFHLPADTPTMKYALLTLVALLSGCSQSGHWALFDQKPESAPVSAAKLAPVAAAPPAQVVQPAPHVNVFGEINGRFAPPESLASDTYQKNTNPEEGRDADVSLDPTGHWLVFTSTRHSEHPKIYLQHPDGQSVIQLTKIVSEGMTHVKKVPDAPIIALGATISAEVSLEEQV